MVKKPTDWSGLADEAKAESRSHGPKCSVGILLENIHDLKIRKMVQDVIEDARISATAVQRALLKRLGDNTPSAYSIRIHRRKDCRCSKAVQ